MKNKCNILSLDGGGIRGVMLLQQLIVLENELNCNICEYFDIITGTSTGSIIAVLLALGYKATDILELYLNHANKIFKKQFLRFGIFRPKYNDKYFNKILKDYVGNKTTNDLVTHIIVPAYNITTKKKRIFKSIKDNNVKLFDIIRSSSSAQSFFKPHKINGENYIDGGMVINNPALVSYIDAINMGYINISILSFSTGIKDDVINDKTINGGLLRWAKPTVDILLAEQAQITDYHMASLGLEYNNLLYTRCNTIILKSSGKIDDVSNDNMQNMLQDGNASALRNKTLLQKFLQQNK